MAITLASDVIGWNAEDGQTGPMLTRSQASGAETVFSSTIAAVPAPVAAATRIGSGDKIGVYIAENGGSTVTYPANIEYTVGVGGALTAAAPYNYPASNGIKVSAYYPYNPGAADAYEFFIEADQSGGFGDIDLMYAPAKNFSSSPSAQKIELAHQLSKVSYSLVKGSNISQEEFAAAEVTIFGLGSSLNFDRKAGVQGEGAGSAPIEIAADAQNEALLIPAAYTASDKLFRVKVGVAGFVYAPTGGIVLAAGKHYSFTITVDLDGILVTLDDQTKPWDNSDTVIEGDAALAKALLFDFSTDGHAKGFMGMFYWGGYIYGSRWDLDAIDNAAGKLYMWSGSDGVTWTANSNGTIPGVAVGRSNRNLGHFTTDGTYIYATNRDKTIYVIDPAYWTLKGTITGDFPEEAGRYDQPIAYDGDKDGFWMAAMFGKNVYFYDKEGSTPDPQPHLDLSALPVPEITGLAYDNVSKAGNPYLWIYSGANNTLSYIHRYDLISDELTEVVNFNIYSQFKYSSYYNSGSLFLYYDYSLGKHVLGGVSQTGPADYSRVFGFDLEILNVIADAK